MARATALVLALGVPLISVLACARNPTKAARVELHERWNAQQFHAIYADSAIGEKATSREEQWVAAWSRQRRDFGKFEKDVGDAPVSESQTSYGGYRIVSQIFNTRFTAYPIVETIHWQIKDGRVRLATYSQVPNAEVRCERRLLKTDCRVVQLGPVAATPR